MDDDVGGRAFRRHRAPDGPQRRRSGQVDGDFDMLAGDAGVGLALERDGAVRGHALALQLRQQAGFGYPITPQRIQGQRAIAADHRGRPEGPPRRCGCRFAASMRV